MFGTGAAFVGEGGRCGIVEQSNQNVYGYYRREPQKTDLTNVMHEIGSIGKEHDIETAGGGRLLLYFDSFTLEGEGARIQANARPYADAEARRYGLPGGSGGYIYVHTRER